MYPNTAECATDKINGIWKNGGVGEENRKISGNREHFSAAKGRSIVSVETLCAKLLRKSVHIER